MQKYNKYHSDLKLCFALGLEKQVLPQRMVNEIPTTTSHYWKTVDPDKYVGSELSTSIQNSLGDTQVFLDERLELPRAVFIQFARLYLTILSLVGKEKLQKLIKENRNSFISAFENLSEDFPVSKSTLLRLVNISEHRYKIWLSQRKFACSKSLIGQCFKKRPNQISMKELDTLKKYMKDIRYKIWCTSSVWGKAVRQGAVSMSESTWYKYSKKLGFSKERKKAKIKRKRGSYDATQPNETWHADISQYKTFDNTIFYIYTVVDNFSRKIIAHAISRTKSAKIRTKTIKDAIEREFGVNINHQPKLDLIVDGGSENNNKTVHEFIKECQVLITKKIALRDVSFSNSIVEGPYKIMKSYYFRTKEILSTTIKEELEFFIENYNYEKPCNKHKIYTPDEVHQNPELATAKLVLSKSNQKRLEENRNYCCQDAA